MESLKDQPQIGNLNMPQTAFETKIADKNTPFLIPVHLTNSKPHHQSIILSQLWRFLLQQYKWLFFAGVIGFILGCWAVTVMTPKYEATLTLTEPAVQLSMISGVQTQDFSLGNILGGMEERQELIRFQNMLLSSRVGDALQSNVSLYRQLFGQEWDDSSQQWRAPDGFKPKQFLRKLFGLPVYAPPDGRRFSDYVNSVLKVQMSKEKGILTVRYRSSNPEKAKIFLQTLYDTTNAILREEDLATFSAMQKGLEAKILRTRDIQQRTALYKLMSQYDYKTTLAALDNIPYAAQKMALSVTPLPVSPNPLWTPILGGVLSGVLGLAVMLILFLKKLN